MEKIWEPFIEQCDKSPSPIWQQAKGEMIELMCGAIKQEIAILEINQARARDHDEFDRTCLEIGTLRAKLERPGK